MKLTLLSSVHETKITGVLEVSGEMATPQIHTDLSNSLVIELGSHNE